MLNPQSREEINEKRENITAELPSLVKALFALTPAS
jgi:hypothetical protein